jgi:hypothetical protein
MRYTLGEERADGLCVVLDRGKETGAYSDKDVVIHHSCVVLGGYFLGGTFNGGTFYGGRFHGGVFNGGYFHDGMFNAGTFNAGSFRGGIFNGGVFNGGNFHRGTFHSGLFEDGFFGGGHYFEGWLPLRIAGSKHIVNIASPTTIAIGCMIMPAVEWVEKFAEVGLARGYSTREIAEYKLYIDLATQLMQAAGCETQLPLFEQ